jgi:hypothetical protein
MVDLHSGIGGHALKRSDALTHATNMKGAENMLSERSQSQRTPST